MVEEELDFHVELLPESFKIEKKLSLCPLWLLVEDEGDESLDSGADGGEGQVDQHEEEQERPDTGS